MNESELRSRELDYAFIRGPLRFHRYWKGFAIVQDLGWPGGATFGYWPRKQWAIYLIKQQPFFC